MEKFKCNSMLMLLIILLIAFLIALFVRQGVMKNTQTFSARKEDNECKDSCKIRK